jgi:hypothetical protein
MKTVVNAMKTLCSMAFAFACISAHAQSQPVWQTNTISGLPPGSQFGAVWARTRNEAYLWVNKADGNSWDSFLYRWNGSQWYKVLDTPGDYGASLFGVGTAEVFAASYTNVWRSTDNGQTWSLQSLPTISGGSYQFGKISGTPGNVHLTVNQGYYGYILRFNGSSWGIAYADLNNPPYDNPPYTLAVNSASEGYFVACWGWGKWDGSQWIFHGRQFDFCDIGDTWWMRDGSGDLQWYAVGANNFANGVRIWKYDPNLDSFGCKYCYVFSAATNYNIGTAHSIWGSAPDDIYVGGELGSTSGGARAAMLYHYNGVNWSQSAAFGPTSSIGQGGISGTARDNVWVSIRESAMLLHYAPPPPALAIHMYAGLTITGQTGATYQIQYTPDLRSPTNWVALTNLVLPASPYIYFDAASAGRPIGFYRALLVQ